MSVQNETLTLTQDNYVKFLPKQVSKEKKGINKAILKKNLSGWLLMLPGIALFTFFVWEPLVMNVVLSFFEGYNMKEFQGFGNYIKIFQDPQFQAAFTNTFKYIFWSLVIGFLIPVILGILLSEVTRGQSFFRICIYLPCIISGIAVAFLFRQLYDPESFSVINTILQKMGLKTSLLRDDKNLVIPLIVVAMTWRGAGGTVLIYLSAMQSIDNSLYEAVRIDGGGLMKRFRYVTLPHLKGTITSLFIMQIISVFQVFYEPMVISNVGPNNASLSLMLLSYNYAFADAKPQLGAAVGVILSLIILACTGVYYLVLRLINGKQVEARR